MIRDGLLPRFELVAETAGTEANLVAWRDATSMLFDVEPIEAPFSAAISSYATDDLLFGTARSTRQRFVRDSAVVRRSGVDHLLIQTYTAGRVSGSAGNQPISFGPGDIAIFDLARTLATEATAFENINLLVPRRLLGLRPGDQSLHGAVFPSESPAAELLAAHMRALVRVYAHLVETDSGQISTLTLALLKSLVAGRLEQAEPWAGLHDSSVFGRICQYIGEHLADDDLTVPRLCDRFAISRASLYRMFDPIGGIATYIRHRRLEKAYDHLAIQPARERLTAIAARCGFPNGDSFARAFKTRYGVGPMRLRQEGLRALSKLHATPNEPLSNTLGQWIRNLDLENKARSR